MNKKLKYGLMALIAVILILLAVVIYRLFFQFNRTKVSGFITDEANTTGNPDAAYRLINEAVQHILKSPDLTKQVLILADISGIEKEKALVQTAVNNCVSAGFIDGFPVIESIES